MRKILTIPEGVTKVGVNYYNYKNIFECAKWSQEMEYRICNAICPVSCFRVVLNYFSTKGALINGRFKIKPHVQAVLAED